MKKNNSFNKNVFTLLTGTSIAQALPIIISPILTRIFSPEDFGILAIITSVSIVLGSIASMRYEIAIVLPKSNIEAMRITKLSLLLVSIFSILLLLMSLVLSTQIATILNLSMNKWVVLYIPVLVFFIGMYNVFNYYNTRISNYTIISNANIQRSISLAISQITFGLLNFGWVGLILAQTISQVTSMRKMSTNFLKDKLSSPKVKFKEILYTASDYRRFPMYSTPAIFTNNLSQQINVFLIPLIANNAIVGVYSIVIRIIATPFTLIGGAISQVYYESGVKQKSEEGHCSTIFLATLKKLIFISIPLFILIYICLNNFVTIIFGTGWEDIISISNILLPLFFVRFISSTLSITLTIYGKEKEFFLLNIIILILSTIPFILSFLNQLEIEMVLKIQSILLSVMYSFLLVRYYFVSRKK